MSPYEILMSGGSNEHFNEETGRVWLERVISKWTSNIWINPNPKENWNSIHSTSIIREIFNHRMVPLSIKGIDEGIKILTKCNHGNLKKNFRS